MDPTRHDGILHIGRPNIGDIDKFYQLCEEMFDRRWLSNSGPLVHQLEQKLASYLGVKHCIPVCNGTVGLQLACHALQLTGEVICPAFTFVATAHALEWEGIRPVFCDIDPRTHNIDASQVEALITDQTSAIVGVHLWGTPCQTDVLQSIADQHDLLVMYDAAHAFGCQHQGQMIGNFGICEVFSFHATKVFNTFEGGAIATNDDALAARLRLMKNFGFEKLDTVVHLGTNGKMPEVCAAMGLACFEKLDQFIAINHRNYNQYRDGLADLPGVKLYALDNLAHTNAQYVVLEIDASQAGRSRDEILFALHDLKIRARRYFFPGCHKMEPYRTKYPEYIERLPQTDRIAQRVLQLPTGTAMSPDNVAYVCDSIRTILGH